MTWPERKNQSTHKLLIATSILAAQVAFSAEPAIQGFETNQTERQIEAMPEPERVAVTRISGDSAKTQVEMSNQTFVLAGVLVEGVTVYQPLDFLPIYQAYLGRPITVEILTMIAEAITRRYQDDGYFLSSTFLPAQDIEFGIVRIRVIEGYIASWRSPDSETSSDPLITRVLQPVLMLRPARKADLVSALTSIASVPGLSVQSRVRAIPGEIGAYELLLSVEKRHLGVTVSVDNRGSDYIGPTQGVIALQAFDMTSHHESYQLKFATVTEVTELNYWDLSTEWLLRDDGIRLHASGTHTSTYPGGSLESLDAHIVNNRYRMGFIYHLSRTATLERNIGTYIDRYNSRTALAGVPRLQDVLTVVTINFLQIGVDRRGATQSVGASVMQGLAVGDSRVVDFQLGNGVGVPDFTKVNASYGGTFPVGGYWSVSVLLDGQYAGNSLPSSERYSIGGAQIGRAYDPSEITGDHGLAGLVELQRRDVFSVRNSHSNLFGFYDLGAVWQIEHETVPARASLASAGFGLRLIGPDLTASIELAQPLTRSVASEGPDGYNPRAFASLAYRF